MFPCVWETAFIATSLAIGETLEMSVQSIDPTNARVFLDALGASDRRERAKTLASAIAAIVFDLENAEVTWAP